MKRGFRGSGYDEGKGISLRKSFETKGMAMAGKYTPLENYLRGLPESQRVVTLRFEEIERILGSKLPSSAYEDRRWWDHETEGNHVSKRAWASAGWKIESLDVNKKRVKFVRAE
jgi:hypothetical protein